MKSQSVPTKGVHTDTDITKHNQSYARESINGRFTKDGIIGTWETVDLFNQEFYQYEKNLIGEIVFEGDTYLFLHNEQQETNNAEIWKYSSIDGSSTLLWQRSNDVLNWDKDYPITGFLQRSQDGNKVIAYLTDNNNPPLAFDILDVNTQSVNISELYISQKKGKLFLSLYRVRKDGNLIPATYYYGIRAYKDSGIRTDWTMMIGKVVVPKFINTTHTPQDFQRVEGGSFDEKSNALVELYLNNINLWVGWKIQVASFIALDEITLDVGKIFFDGLPTAIIKHTSNVSYGDVSIDEIGLNTLSVIKCKEYRTNGDISVIGNIEIESLENGEFFDNLKFKNALNQYGDYLKIEIDLRTSRIFNNSSQKGICLDIALDDQVKWFMNSGKTKEAYFGTFRGTSLTPTNIVNLWRRSNSSIAFKGVSIQEGFSDHSNPILEHYFPIYRKGEERRLALLPFDLYGKPTRPIFLGDLKTNNPTNSVGTTLMSKFIEGVHTKIETGTESGHFYTERGTGYRWLFADTNFIEIKNIILNDFVDFDGTTYTPKISGFSIIECDPPVKRIIAEGFATRIQKYENNKGIIHSFYNYPNLPYSRLSQAGGWLIVYSPQLMYGTETLSPGMKIITCSREYYPKLSHISEQSEAERAWQFFDKWYERNENLQTEQEGIIDEVYELPFYPEEEIITVAGLGTFKNIINPDTSGPHMVADAISIGPRKTFLIKLQTGSGLYDFINNENNFNSSRGLFEIRIENQNYGFQDQSDINLSGSIYKFTNHYQSTDASFFQSIKNISNDFITDIFTYGGKYKAGIFEVARYIVNNNKLAKNRASSVMYMPVLTDFNLRLRAGNRHSKNRIVLDGNTTGIGLWQGNGVYEENLFNSTYKNVRNSLELYPVPISFSIINKIRDTVFWSNKITLQGGLDELRVFYPSQYKICDRRGGQINGLVFTNDRLYVFQENSIGFLPYEEKTMAPTVSGGQFTISYGDIFPKYERMSSSKGLLSNQLMRSLDELIIYFSSKDSSINLVTPNGIKDITVELGIKELCKEFKNATRLRLHAKNNIISIALQYLEKILDVNLTYGICNGYQKIKQDFSPIAILNMGYELGINSEMDAPRPQTRIYIENKPNSSIKLYDTSSLVLVMGSESLEQKTFDNLIITSDRNKLPKTINFIIGNDDISEPIIGNQYALIDDNTINISTPLRVPLSTTKSMRLRDDSVMLVKLSSDDMFRIHDVICEIRKNL